MRSWLPLLLLASLVACPGPVDDTAIVDTADTASGDTGTDTDTDTDSDTDTDTDTDSDTSPTVPLDGYGTISGDCGVLDADEWGSADPFAFDNAIVFDSAYDSTLLGDEGEEVVDDGGLNPGSVDSEGLAMDLLDRCELADLIATESEVTYEDAGGKKTDIVVDIDGRRIGVSVTRGFAYDQGPCATYTEDDAEALLDDKLADLPLALDNAVDSEAWERSILYVLACDDPTAATIEQVWADDTRTPPSLRADHILMITATHGEDGWVYGQ